MHNSGELNVFTVKTGARTTPLALAASAGAGLLSYLFCHKVLRQNKLSSLIQACAVSASAVAAFKSPPQQTSLYESYVE